MRSSAPLRRVSFSQNSGILLLVLLVLGIFVGIAHNKLRAAGRSDPLLGGLRLFSRPFQVESSGLMQNALLDWKSLFQASALQRENERLVAENAQLRLQNETLAARSAEADRLEAALQFAHAQVKPLLACHVIALLPQPHFESITVDRGAADGIGEKTVARTPEGLIGQVTDVSGRSADIMLLSDLNSGVSGLLRRNGKTLGIVGVVQGNGRGQALTMIDLKREADVHPGDTVVTSGLGGVYPPDIPIGTIASVENENLSLLKSATIAPAAPQTGDLREVYLLKL